MANLAGTLSKLEPFEVFASGSFGKYSYIYSSSGGGDENIGLWKLESADWEGMTGTSSSSVSSSNWGASGNSDSRVQVLRLDNNGGAVTKIPGYFLKGTFVGRYSKGIIEGLKNFSEIGQSFLERANYFHATLVIPSSIERVGSAFMYDAASLESIFIEEGVPPPTDDYSLAVSSNRSQAYVEGVRLTGPGALAWKAALPDRTTSPYRKLILA